MNWEEVWIVTAESAILFMFVSLLGTIFFFLIKETHSYAGSLLVTSRCAIRGIRMLLTVKKFFCRVTTCPRKIFVERLPDLIEVSSRLTKRLRSAVQEIGFATCGKGGERLSSKLGMPLSDATLLWSLYLVPLPPIGKVQVIGIDDWSWRRGKRYGSIIVDLRTHKIIDLRAFEDSGIGDRLVRSP